MRLFRKLGKYFLFGFKTIFSSKIVHLVILLLTFFITSYTTYRSITLQNKINTIESKITAKSENYVKIEYPDIVNTDLEGALGITNCLKTPLKKEELTTELINVKNELENLFNENNLNFAFKYKDIYTGFSLSYNSSQDIFAASAIKAPEAIYIYEEAEKNNINLNETLTYTSNFYTEGTGVLKDTSPNKDYSIHELVKYSIINSDNIAHLMLNNKFKSSNIHSYWSNLGASSIYKDNNAWGNINANDATIVMEELYKYYINPNNKYSNELINYFINSWKVITNYDNNLKVASKSGWSGTSLHDMTLVLDENPYTLVILSNRGYVEYQDFFNQASNLVYEFHNLYWKEKMNYCINQ